MLKIAKKKLKNNCLCCNKSFVKGETYRDVRKVIVEDKIFAWTERYCSKCYYKISVRKERFEKFKDSGNCEHPIKNTCYSLIVGEDYVLDPNGYECMVCGSLL